MTQKLTWLEIFLLYSHIFHVHFPQTEPKQEQNKSLNFNRKLWNLKSKSISGLILVCGLPDWYNLLILGSIDFFLEGGGGGGWGIPMGMSVKILRPDVTLPYEVVKFMVTPPPPPLLPKNGL